jgi:hypothetical protein
LVDDEGEASALGKDMERRAREGRNQTSDVKLVTKGLIV